MSFLAVLCEGYTEMDFVGAVLREHLNRYGVAVHPILLGKKIKHDIAEAPGGVFQFDSVYRHITATLRSYSSETSFVTTMLDLYAFPRDFADYRELARIEDPSQRVEALELAMGNRVKSPRFLPYIQLHEFEALVLSKTDELPAEFEEPAGSDGVQALSRDIGGLKPEEVNETKEGAPSKRLTRFLPGYRKRDMGVNVTKRIGCAHLRTTCPHFAAWLSGLEAMGGGG